jgi:hypothetical protein
MPVTDVIPDVAGHTVDDEGERWCSACPHPWTAHDGIAVRFCTATVVGGYHRGCVCTHVSTAPDGAK